MLAAVKLTLKQSSLLYSCWQQTWVECNRCNRNVIDLPEFQCNSNSNRFDFWKCNSNSNSNRLKLSITFLLTFLLHSITFLHYVLAHFSWIKFLSFRNIHCKILYQHDQMEKYYLKTCIFWYNKETISLFKLNIYKV